MQWTREIYELWREGWTMGNPGRTPPDFEQFTQIAEIFSFSPEEIFESVMRDERS